MTQPAPRGAPGRPSTAAPSRRARWAARVRHSTSGAPLRAGALLAAVTMVCVEAPLLASDDEVRGGVALAAALVHAGPLALAPRSPRRAALLSVVGALVVALVTRHGQLDATALWPWPVVPMITECLTIAVVCLAGGWPVGLGLYLASVLVPTALVAAAAGHRPPLDAAVSDLLVFACIAGTVLLLTAVLKSRTELGAALAREQQLSAAEHARRRLVEERSRIARELHDVVAHSMSLISVQARSAAVRLPDVSPAAAAEFEDIADRARDALDQMRDVLAVLRTSADAPDRSPQPGLAQVRDLVDTVRAAGTDVTLTWLVPPGLTVPALTGLSAHRIVQEALSNVMRHAGELPAEVTVLATGGELVVTVENVLLGPPGQEGGAGGSDRDGHGLLGMGERATAAGGRLECGPTPVGTFRVRAHLPLGARPGGRTRDPAVGVGG